MGALSPIILEDVVLKDYWNCSPSGTSGVSTVSESKTVQISGIPVGASNIAGYLTVTTGSPYSGASICTINGQEVEEKATQNVPITISGNGTVTIEFKFRPNGHSLGHTASHTSTMSFTAMVLNVSYSEPQTTFIIENGSSINAGGSLQLTQTPPSSSCSHDILIQFGAESYSTSLAAGTNSMTYTQPMSWLNQIPNSTSGVGFVSVTTKLGSEVFGTKTQSFTIMCPSSVIPLVGGTASAIKNSALGKIQQRYSSASITLESATGVYGSTITSAVITGNSRSSYFTSVPCTFETGEFTSSGNVEFLITVFDSRGRQASKTVYISVSPYQEPEIHSVYAERCNASNVSSSMGTAGHILIDCSYDTVGGSNQIVTTVEYKKSSDSSWIVVSNVIPSSTNYFMFANVNSIDSSASYNVRVTVRDTVGKSAITTCTIGNAYAFMQWEPGIDAISFGCYPSGGKRFEVSPDWSVYAYGKDIRSYIPQTNYIDNGYFLNPVNQRQIASKVSPAGTMMSLDRWELYGTSNTVFEITDQVGISLKGASSTEYIEIRQRLEKYAQLVGQAFTVAWCDSSGIVRHINFSLGEQSTSVSTGGLKFRSTSTEHIAFRNETSIAVQIQWIALYKGTFSAESVPTYIPKGYAAELQECRRFFIRIGTSNGESFTKRVIGAGRFISTTICHITLFLPTVFYSNPNMSLDDGQWGLALKDESGYPYMFNVTSVKQIPEGGLLLILTMESGSEAESLCGAQLIANSALSFSADL